jgi:RNA 2',3'-cyclic 3'-phosphodiesterase
MPRLFVAIDIPERIKDDITATFCAMQGARWVEDPQIHLTLRFIGEVSNDSAELIDKALRQVKGRPFSLRAKGVGFFPPRNEPRILWTGIAENDELMRLQPRIERAVISAGMQHDERKFHPHVTIARLHDTRAGHVARFITQNSLFMTEEFSVSSFQLYSSTLGKEGAIHTKEASYRLAETEGC